MEIAKGILPASKPQDQQREVYVIHVQRHTDSQQKYSCSINKQSQKDVCAIWRQRRDHLLNIERKHIWNEGAWRASQNVCPASKPNNTTDWPGETRRVVFDLMSARRICFTFNTMEKKSKCGSWKSLFEHVTCSANDIMYV